VHATHLWLSASYIAVLPETERRVDELDPFPSLAFGSGGKGCLCSSWPISRPQNHGMVGSFAHWPCCRGARRVVGERAGRPTNPSRMRPYLSFSILPPLVYYSLPAALSLRLEPGRGACQLHAGLLRSEHGVNGTGTRALVWTRRGLNGGSIRVHVPPVQYIYCRRPSCVPFSTSCIHRLLLGERLCWAQVPYPPSTPPPSPCATAWDFWGFLVCFSMRIATRFLPLLSFPRPVRTVFPHHSWSQLQDISSVQRCDAG
jgi:hypothetical protein